MSANIAESYVRQQGVVKEILRAMKSKDAESVAKYLPILVLEIFKNHNLTDVKSCDLIDTVVRGYLTVETQKINVPSLDLELDEEND